MRFKTFLATVAAVLAAISHSSASAQADWPNKPVKIVAAAGAGGATDVFGRMLAQRLSEKFGQPFVVENKGGAGGSIGALSVAQSPADGYTLLMTTDQLVIQAVLSSVTTKPPYDVFKDFTPIGLVARGPRVLGVNASFPAKSLVELVVLVKANPGKYAFSSCGHGGVEHLTGEMFNLAAGIDLSHVAYRGCAPAILDAVTGQVPIFVNGTSTAMPHEKSGKLRFLAVTAAQRLPNYPNLPTMAELGFPGLSVSPWFGLLAPAATPAPVVASLSAEVARAVESAAFVQRILSMEMEPGTNTPGSFGSVMRADFARWSKVVRDAKIKPE